ncbi:hypothetical protein B0T19DRAFT_477361 [Cercophora scortea]|uniref:Uncharacterized protein n=1 Tax=Cercophora scortea TaxID=314031 RepID=A0AAE0M9K1_9PEZI|nr:hypothetical protein B0T19DRAFT_477361 [Cercophora scortea]
MSATRVSQVWTLLHERRDISHLVSELIGSHSLSLTRVSPSNSHASPVGAQPTHSTRQLLVRLKTIFDHQLSRFAQRDVVGTTLDSTATQDFFFDTTIYVLHVGANIETPTRLGRAEYLLHRGLVLTTFLSTFRALNLHREPLTSQQQDVLRQRATHLADAWHEHQALSIFEGLALRTLVRDTLDAQDLDERCTIKTFGCTKFDRARFQQGRSPFCIDPASPECRRDSIRRCQGIFTAALDNLHESNWVEAFWTLHDMIWALMDAAVRSSGPMTLDSERYDGVSTEARSAGMDLCDAVHTMLSSFGSGTLNNVLCGYFEDSIVHLCGTTEFLLVPATVAVSDRARQGVDVEIVELQRFLIARDSTLSRQYRQRAPQPQRAGPSRNLNIVQTLESALEEEESWDPRPEEPPLVSPIERPPTSATGYSAVLPPPHIQRTMAMNGEAPFPDATRETATQRTAQRHGGCYDHVRPQSDPDSDLTGGYSGYLDTQATAPPRATRAGSQQGLFNRPPPSDISRHSSARDHSSGSWSTFSPQPSTEPDTPASEDRPFYHEGSQAPSITSQQRSPREPLSPAAESSYTIDDGLQAVHTEERKPRLPHPPHPPATPEPRHYVPQPYIPSPAKTPSLSGGSATSKSKTNILSSFGLGKRTSAKSSNRGSIEKATSIPVPEDLSFCFSAAGTSLLLWTKKTADHIVKLHWPFEDGQKLWLTTPGEANTPSLRLVQAGTSLVAAVAFADSKCKLFHYDQAGVRGEVVIQNANAVPTALAVSRDDTKIAVSCGAVVFLYNVTDGTVRLTGTPPAHSRSRAVPGNRRLQRLNFSIDSKVLVVATQEHDEGQTYPIYVTLWRCLPESPGLKFEAELDPVFLGLGYGDDPGLSGIFCSIDQATFSNSRIFLTAQATKTYPSILTPSKDQRNKYLTGLSEKRIDAAAQTLGPSEESFGSFYVFKSGKHDICTVDIRTGIPQTVASFASERASLKIHQETMALAFPKESLALAMWKGRDGGLVLKQLELAPLTKGPRQAVVHSLELREAYLKVARQV